MYTADYRYVCSHFTFMFCFWVVECTVFARVIFFHIYHKTSFFISITNSSGLATWTVPCDEWGLQTYSAGSKEIQVNVTGWKTVSLGISYATFYVNEAIRMCELRYVREFSIATGDTFYTWHSSAIPEDYRPPAQVNGAINQVGTLYVDSNGEIGGKFANSFSSTRNCKASVIWHY